MATSFLRILAILAAGAWSFVPLHVHSAGTSHSNPAVAPSGRQIAFYSDRSGTHQIYVYDLESKQLSAVTNNDDQNYGPAWSPDGREIVWYRGDDRHYEIWKIDLESGSSEQITNFGAYAGNPSYSPDGEWIAFSSNHESEKSELYKLHLASGRLVRLTNNEARDWTPTWSPDGKSIVFASDRRADGQFDIMVMRSDGTQPRMLADLHDHDYYPEWSPDGRHVALFSGPDFDSFDLYQVDVYDGAVERLTEGLGAGKASWMPDSRTIVFDVDSEEGTQIVLMDIATKRTVPALHPD